MNLALRIGCVRGSWNKGRVEGRVDHIILEDIRIAFIGRVLLESTEYSMSLTDGLIDEARPSEDFLHTCLIL